MATTVEMFSLLHVKNGSLPYIAGYIQMWLQQCGRLGVRVRFGLLGLQNLLDPLLI